MILPYHVSVDGEYCSMSFANTSRTVVESERESHNTGYSVIKEFERDSETGVGTGSALYVLYTGTEPIEPEYPERECDEIVVQCLLNVFRSVTESGDVTWNKRLEPEGVANAIETVQWRQSVREVGADIFSSLVCRHALPNANHRSSLGLLSVYLETSGMPSLAEGISSGAISEDVVDGFIQDSKRYLTVRRNAGLFQWLSDHGVSGVVRKNGVKISFSDFRVGAENPTQHFTDQHLERSRQFVTDVSKALQSESVVEQEDDGKRAFADRISRYNRPGCVEGELLAGLRD